MRSILKQGHTATLYQGKNKDYHELPLSLRSRLTAFNEDGYFELQTTFGLKNAPVYFQRTVDAILGACLWDFALEFIDDIIVVSRSF